MNEHVGEEAESLGEVVQQELEAILPFTAKLRRAVEQLGELAVLLGRTIARAVKPPFSLSAIAYQVEVLGVRSLSIGILTAMFAGLVMSLQFAFFMARFGVQHTVGKVVSLSIFRELGADPIKKLAVPRVLACVIVLPALAVLADVFAFVAGSAVVNVEYDIPFDQFYRSAIESTMWADFISGIAKSAIFGIIIAAVGCYKGFHVEGGTEGVGRATTETVAIASVAVLLADFFLTKLLLAL